MSGIKELRERILTGSITVDAEVLKQYGLESLDGLDLSHQDIHGLRLEGISARGMNLKGTRLTWFEVDGVDMSKSTMKRAELSSSTIKNSTLDGFIFECATVYRSQFMSCSMQEAKFILCHLREVDFNACNARGIWLWRSAVVAVSASDTSMVGASLEETRIDTVIPWTNVDLSDARFDYATIRMGKFDGGSLAGAKLEGATILEMHLYNHELPISVDSAPHLFREVSLAEQPVKTSPFSAIERTEGNV